MGWSRVLPPNLAWALAEVGVLLLVAVGLSLDRSVARTAAAAPPPPPLESRGLTAEERVRVRELCPPLAPRETASLDLLGELARVATLTEVELDAPSAAEHVPADTSAPARTRMRVHVKGAAPAQLSYLRAIDESPLPIAIVGLRWTAGSRAGACELQLTVDLLIDGD